MATSAMSDYEIARAKRIAENQQRMAQLGVLQIVDDIKKSVVAKRTQNREQRAARKAAVVAARAPPRRSSRVEGLVVPNYNENAMLLALADGNTADCRDRRLVTDNREPEQYGVEHLKALGSHQQPWELFVDGYDSEGNRIYDKVNGQTCHQCRQKTLGKRTCCSQCKSLSGTLCGDCLMMRYGENVEEALANKDWACPVCRDICNCSICRMRKGFAPTGTLYRRATAEGYKSCAHYLVLNNLKDAATKRAALEIPGLCPPELGKELEKEIKGEEQGEAAGPSIQGQATQEDRTASAAAVVGSQLLEVSPAPAQEEEAEEAKPAGKKATRGAAVRVEGRKRKATAAAVPASKAAKVATSPAAAPRRRGLRSAVKA